MVNFGYKAREELISRSYDLKKSNLSFEHFELA